MQNSSSYISGIPRVLFLIVNLRVLPMPTGPSQLWKRNRIYHRHALTTGKKKQACGLQGSHDTAVSEINSGQTVGEA